MSELLVKWVLDKDRSFYHKVSSAETLKRSLLSITQTILSFESTLIFISKIPFPLFWIATYFDATNDHIAFCLRVSTNEIGVIKG